jgi:hypothetical protein
MRTTASVWIALLFIGAALAAPPAEDGVAKGVTAFYEAHARLQLAGGVPDAGQRAQLRPLVSPALDGALAAADDAEARYAKKTNKQVPPLVQGDLFTSLFEGASRFAVASCTGDAARASCLVDFAYQEAKGGPETKWQDRVHVVKAAGGWVVDDVEYGGSWPFARRGRLTDTLKAVVREADK